MLPAAVSSVEDAFDEQRWRTLFRAHGDFLRRVLARHVGHTNHVDDIVQQTFVVAFHKKNQLPTDDGKLRGWLYRTAMNIAQHSRRSTARTLRKHEALADAPVPPSPGPSEVVEAKQRVDLVRAAIAALPQKSREAFVLVDLEQLTAPDAATILSVPEDTVRSRLRTGRERFKAYVLARRHLLEGSP